MKTQIEGCFTHHAGPGKLPAVQEIGPRNIVGLVCPHAGYRYSGPVAANAYYYLAADGKPDVIIILGPNHTGRGSALALMSEGTWRTPLGDVAIDTLIAQRIVAATSIIDIDDSAHAFEHSIEVQLPFLQYLYGSAFRFVPVSFLMQDLQASREVGRAVAEVLQGRNGLVIASTDMTHYEPHEQASRKDHLAINAARQMDEALYYSVVERYNITTCGYGPTVAAITAAKQLQGRSAQLLCYRTSGDITGDFSSVVGYASLAFTKSQITSPKAEQP